MVFGSAFSSPLGSLSSKQALELANVYLENARSAVDLDIALVLCHDTEVSLSQAKKHPDNQTIIEGIATAYGDLGSQLEIRGNDSGAQAMYKKAGKLGWKLHDMDQSAKSPSSGNIIQPLKGTSPSTGGSYSSGSLRHFSLGRFKHRRTVAVIPAHIFTKNVPPSAFEFKLPEPDERLNSTRQLANCLSLLKASPSETLLPAAHKWLQVIRKDADEQDRLRSISIEIIRAFKRDRIKDSKVVGEVVCLAPALNKDSFRDLLKEFYSGIDHSGLLDIHQLDGLAQMMQGADHGYLGADDLVKILDLLSARLKDTHHQSADHRHGLTLAISHVLDAMADTNVKDLDRKKLHEPLSSYLSGLMKSSDPYLVYQAAYASQALLCVPDNETPWQAALRRTGKVVQGVSGLVSAVKGVDLNKFLNGLDDIQKGLEGASKVVDIVATAYKNAAALSKSGQSFFKSLKEGLSFDRKRDWYAALRGADIMIRDGEFASFRRLICEAPCRLDPAFQWGVCQRLCEIAINPIWDVDTRQGAVSLMGEIYRNDEIWGQHVSVKQWILNILMQLSIPSEDGLQLHTAIAETMLQGLEADGDTKKQDMCRVCRENGPISYPLKTTESKLASPSLLDRAQNRPDVEGSLRFLRKQRTGDRDNIVYIPPQAKNGLQASDDDQFPLMEKVNEFLESERKVFLLLGESGAGKSTFNHQLEFNLWNSYKTRTGRIPLYINLPAIDKPEHDLIAKQLRKSEFTEPQIRELKHHRRFILICDGYDESQQTRNLYVSNNLNQKGEWDVQMLISCRSEYLGIDYRDRFQPGDRNQQSSPLLLQEAVITSFSRDQVQAYIEQYVTLRQPLWQTEDYEQALELIPSLYDLVKNPFLMSLSLEVLPRMIDPGKQLSDARVTRVALYDHFMEQWFERSKKRLGEIDLSPQSRVVYESLSNEGFTQNGIDFLKALSVAIYKNQGGNPVVQYSRAKDEGSWKTEFFSRDEEKQILREACPLSRNANQYRFIHRSILEYGLSIAVFDPHDQQQTHPPESALGRRGSVQSAMSFEILDTTEKEATVLALEPDISSPLMWKSFVNDNSLLQFLQERAQHEQVFKKQLLSYIEHSKKDKKWRTAAANAITILVQAGYQFIGTDLEGIQIPGSDLSYGVFDSVQLQEADLRKANLRGVWMRGSDLGGALMSGAQFGEHPLITQDYGARSCTYSPDGQSFAMGLYNGDIAVYSTSTWDILQTLRGHYDTIRSVVYSPMGDHIASCSRDYTLRLWDTETGECRFILIGHTGPVHGIAYSPQGDTIASASGDGTVRLWDVATGECRRTLLGHERKVLSVVYSPDEINIASGGTDATVRIWNAESGHCDLILSGHKDAIWAVAFSHQGEQLASASADKTVRLWDVATWTCRHILTGHASIVYSVAYSSNGYEIASGGMDTTIRLWDIESGSCRHTLTGHSSSVLGVAYSPKGDQIASCSHDKTLRLWNPAARESSTVSNGNTTQVNGVAWSPKGDTVVSCSGDHTIRLWDAETGSCRRTLRGHTQSVFSIAISPQGGQFVSGSGDNSARLWDMASGLPRHTFSGHDRWINCVAFSPQGNQIATGSMDNTVRLWDVATGECTGILDGHKDGTLCVAYSPDGKKIVTGGKDFLVRRWDVATFSCIGMHMGHKDWVRAVAFSPDGAQFATGSFDAQVRLWKAESGRYKMTLTGHKSTATCVAYSPNGDILASCSKDKTVRLWDVASGQCRAVIENIPEIVWSLCWRAAIDGNYIVTGSNDGSVLMWRVMGEEEQYRSSLKWGSSAGMLTVTGASIEGARGLTRINRQLLSQRGALGEAVPLLREASKTIVAMASVLSRLKQASHGVAGDSTQFATPPLEQLEEVE